ncbi:FHA domain-containing protein, partial [Ilumatobacter sp.]|uniref:FHA domain-containing protein n=1 Tax=Ilumatobacter sp. TaxID=1967498 RepID=UPI003C67B72F
MDRTHLPPLDVVGPDGERITLRSLDRDSTVDVLARSLDVETLRVERELGPDELLAEIDELRVGARLTSLPSLPYPVPDTERSQPVVEVAVVAGPSTTIWQRLGPGRHLIGRAPHVGIRLDDPAIELHHALLRIGEDRSVQVIQLCGSVPIRIDGRPWDGIVTGNEAQFSIGASAIRLRRLSSETDRDGATGMVRAASDGPVGSVEVHPSDPWRRVVWRAPYESATWSASTVTAPVPPIEPHRPALSGLIGTAVMALGAVVIAVVMANPMFMLFAGMGVVAAVATFIVGLVSTRRRRTHVRAAHTAELAAFTEGLDALHAARREY